MSLFQHTPGPWESDWQYIVAPDPTGEYPDIYIAEIAEEDEEGRVASPEQQAANARLIAAAPEMFDALAAIASGNTDPDRKVEIALAAIAKATQG